MYYAVRGTCFVIVAYSYVSITLLRKSPALFAMSASCCDSEVCILLLF